MATYKYQQNLADGASAGYVQYNVTPDFDTVLAVGETFEVTGKLYCGNLKRYGIAVTSPRRDGSWDVELGWIPKECNRYRTITFSITCTVKEGLWYPFNGAERRLVAPISFLLYDNLDDPGGESTVNDDAAQQYTLLRERLAPVVNAVTINDSTGAFAHFGGAVDGKSDLSFALDVTLDPLDPSLVLTSAVFIAGDNRRDIDGSKINGSTVNLGVVDFNGTFDSWFIAVTDSKGEAGNYTGGSFVAYPYRSPALVPYADKDLAERYSVTFNDIDEEVVALDDAGTYLWASFVADTIPINGKNAWTVTREYAEFGYDPANDAVVVSQADGANYSTADDQTVFPRSVTFAANKRYTVQLVLADYFESATLSFDVDKAGGYFNIEKYGVAAGMRSTATEGDPKTESAYPVYPYAGIKLCDNAVYEVPLTLDASGKFKLYSEASPLKLMVYGNVVHLIGEVTPTASISGNNTEHAITTIPAQYAPKHPVTVLCQASSAAVWMLRAYPADDATYPGLAVFSRHRNGSSYASCAAGNWLPFTASWMAFGVAAEEDDPDTPEDVEVTVERPAAAMTGYSSRGCVASASSEYSDNTYAAWRAFNKSYSDQYGWAADSGVLNAWLQLEMDVPLKKISVTIINRTYTYTNGPEAGVIYGSNDGEEWTSIGTFSGRDGSTKGGRTVHECSNDEIAYRYVRVNVSRSSGGVVAIGEMIIEGVEVS